MNIINDLKLFSKDLDLLVVEDDINLNSELIELFNLFFKKVDSAFDGQEALIKYKEHTYDIVFTDIIMPNLNGIDLCKEIKEINENQVILVLSALDDFESITQLINMNVNQFISKPFKEEQLFYKLLKICENIVYRKNYKKINIQINSGLNNNIKKRNLINSKDFFSKLLNEEIFLNKEIEQFTLDLINLDKKFDHQIQILYLNKLNEEFISKVIEILDEIAKKFESTRTLTNFGLVLKRLSNFLASLNFSKLNKIQIDNLRILEFIYDDISRFIYTVFVYKDSIDVNYLEYSLKSSIEQINGNILDEKIIEEELELFSN